jgi:hypothetical protein
MYVYKGTQKFLKSLLPEQVLISDLEKLKRNGITTNKVIWATNILVYAEIFALFGTKLTFEIHRGYGFNPKLQRNSHFYKVSIEETNWIERINLEEPCFVYIFDSAKFARLDTGEYISRRKAVPITILKYKRKDLLKKLINNPTVDIYAIEIYSYTKLLNPTV